MVRTGSVTTSLSSANPGKSTRTRSSPCAGRRTDVRDSSRSWLPGQYLVEHIERTAIYPERDGAHGPLLCGGSLAMARADPAPGAWPHQTGLGPVSTERERGSSVVRMRHSGRWPEGLGGDSDTVITSESYGR
jgi:hypothetical protein